MPFVKTKPDTAPDTLQRVANPRRQSLFRALLWVIMAAGLSFCIINLALGVIGLALIELATVCFAGMVLYMSRDSVHLTRWILTFTLPLFIVVLMALVLWRQETASIFVWVLLMPILAHLLLGRWLGLVVSVFFVVAGALIYAIAYQGQPELMGIQPLSNLVMVTLFIVGFSNLYQAGWERSEKALIQMAQTDVLTGLANRSRFLDMFERERRRAQRDTSAFCLLAIDLDHFKQVNDRYGHEAGDTALTRLAQLLNERLRATDLACRMGGEEFSVILVNTGMREAIDVAEDLRQTLEKTPVFVEDATITLTMSVGIAEYGVDGEDLRDLLGAADKRLYHAKETGRNRVVAGKPHS